MRARRACGVTLFLVFSSGFGSVLPAQPLDPKESEQVDIRWNVRIPLRDSVHLDSTLYLPTGQQGPAPCIVAMTPYDAQTLHDRGVYFADHGMPFLAVDVRGRGNSEGMFHPFLQESADGYDVIEWTARQSYCNGKVAMAGYSYVGYVQWATAKERPPHLATIIPTAPAYPGQDFPMRGNIADVWAIQWLIDTSGHTIKSSLIDDDLYWSAHLKEWYQAGEPFAQLDSLVGAPSPVFHEWLSHPTFDRYWESYTPTPSQYASLDIPILTITGAYDGDQVGALQYYQNFVHYASSEARSRLFLVIGPWDHGGTNTPKDQVGGLTLGRASVLDMPALQRAWYGWAMQGSERPEFLKGAVAYYVTGAEQWRYADTLQAITAESIPYFLNSRTSCNDVFGSGVLSESPAHAAGRDQYVYDASDLSRSAYDGGDNPQYLIDQSAVLGAQGHELIYHTAPFTRDTEISGFFRLAVWLGIDRPDTDFRVTVYEVNQTGATLLLSTDQLRARYRQGLQSEKLVTSAAPLLYEFNGFTFVSRQIRQGARLRLVIGPIDSISTQRNYNAGKTVAEESIRDARAVHVSLYHDPVHRSVLYVPIGKF